MSNSLEKELERNRILVQGIMQNPTIKERIAPIYPEERLARGVELYKATKEAFQRQVKEISESKVATLAFNSKKEEVHNLYIKIRKTLRYFYKNDLSKEEVLQFNKTIPTNFSEWTQAIGGMVSLIKSDADVQNKLSIVGVTLDSVNQLESDLASLDDLRIRAITESGEAQMTTQDKEACFNELNSFCVDLRECLDLFFEGKERQVLEKVGIVVK